jgi:hypothetical protein
MARLFTTIAILFGTVLPLFSQDTDKERLEVLQVIRAGNIQLIEKQQKTLQVLEELEKTAEQIRVFSKRT